jgi:hypothetical protein
MSSYEFIIQIKILLTINYVYSKVIEENNQEKEGFLQHNNSQNEKYTNAETIFIIIFVFTILMLLSCINERNRK